MGKIPLILLAAGASRRMGRPKALLPWGNTTLIKHQLEVLSSLNEDIIVVLGAHSEEISRTLINFPVHILINPEWEQGMGTSIAYALKHISQNIPEATAVMISLVDQPLISEAHYRNIYDKIKTGIYKAIISKSSNGWEGVPVVLSKDYFCQLMTLKGEEGAKKLIKSNIKEIISVDAGDMLVDMDTIDSYHNLHYRFFGNKPKLN
ncbi:nucleotidyltransferase family protein [Aegicerativicinus sediminis]